MKYKLILFFVMTLFLISCSKQLQVEVVGGKEYKMLTSKRWKEINIEVIDNGKLHKNITHQFMKSDLDDIILFMENGTYFFDEGQTKARDVSAQIYENGNWQLNSEDKTLVLTTKNLITTYKIKELTDNTLVLELPVELKEYHYLLTYKQID